ncbi:MAG: murein hydrolase activator EnvC family protein [Nitrospiria bacterium]
MKERYNHKEKSIFPIVLMAILIGSAGWSIAQAPPELIKQIDQEKKELIKLETEIEKRRKKNIAAKQEERSLLADVEAIDRRFRLFRKEVNFLEMEIRDKEKETVELSSQTKAMLEDIEETRTLISQRLRTIYKERHSGALRILFSSKSYPDLLRNLYYLNTVALKEGEVLHNFKKKHTLLKGRQDHLEQVKKKLSENRTALTQKLEGSRAEKRQKGILLARVQKERGLYKQAISEMTKASQDIQDILNRLEKEKKQSAQRATRRFSKERGRLRWPNDGRIVGLFGRQKHPKFDTMIYRKGIEISPKNEGLIRNIFDGTTVYADWFRGYGMVIIIDHGENYYSLYAHLEKLLVGTGDRVKKNQVIGEVGGTGLSNGAKLYFEIRHQGKPINPISWLKKRR